MRDVNKKTGDQTAAGGKIAAGNKTAAGDKTGAGDKTAALAKYQTQLLAHGRTEKIGWLEAIPLKLAGHKDGKRGLPKQDDAGDWTSAVLSHETHSFKEFCGRTWGQLQIDLADHFSRLGYLADEAKRLGKRLEEVSQELEKAECSTAPPSAADRRKGEELLSENQIKQRRARENAKRLQPYRSAKQAHETELRNCLQEAVRIRSGIIEANNSARLICERVMDHTRQRLDVYWNAVLDNHPEAERLPAVPSVRLIPEAELVYFQQHRTFLEDAARTISYLSMKYNITIEKEEEAA